MKKSALLFLVVACAFSACKKSNSSPSIVGTWNISGISGSSINQASPTAPNNTVAYSYATPVLTKTDTGNTSLITITTEAWQFNSDGTFTISENYRADTTATSTIHTITGWWDYTSSTLPNSTVVLRASGTPTIVPTGGSYFIQSVSSTRLILTVHEASVSTTGSSETIDFSLTFTKQ